MTNETYVAFSPLFIGAMVATYSFYQLTDLSIAISFSPLFIGAMVATKMQCREDIHMNVAFSPLFIGAMVATSPLWCALDFIGL